MNCVYILRCADGTLYTGWTNDLAARLVAHNRGTSGAKYTRARRPVQLVYCEKHESKVDAMKREASIKRLSRTQKQQLIGEMLCGELLAVYDADEIEMGILPRALVHSLGLRHHVCHLWLVQEREGVIGHWLQKRAADRPLYPGMYDLAATGHIDPGETPEQGMLREAWEEIGLQVNEESIHYIGKAEQGYDRPDGGYDNELVHVFATQVDRTPAFSIGDEVERMIWIPFEGQRCVENGADRIVIGEEEIRSSEMCCLHKGEWELFERYLTISSN